MQQKTEKTKLLLPILMFTFTLALTIYAWKETENFIEYQRREQFNDATREIVIRAEDKLNEYVNILFGARALFSASTKIDRNEWNAYTNSLPTDERFPGIQALSFIARVSLENKENFIEEVRNDTSLISEGYPNFTIYPEGDRKEYYIVTYIEPFEGNEDAFGFDLFSNSPRRAGLEEAMDMNKPVATAPIRLVQEKGEQKGFLIFLPVYKNNMPIETVEEKREALIGYISAVFRAGDLLSALLRNIDATKGLNIDIFDSTDDLGEKSKLVSHKYEENSYQPTFVQYNNLDIAGRKWTLRFEDSSEFFASSTEKILPLIILSAGLIFSVLVFSILYSFARTKSRAIQLAQELTLDLQKFQLAVENASDHIVITDTSGIVLYANNAAEKITGYSKKEMIGVKAGSLWGGKMSRAFYRKMWKTIEKGKESFIGELANVRKNGEQYEAQIRISPVLDEKKSILFFVGIERDITKEKQIDRAKTEFVSLASHQLRTPLTSIKWYAEMLLSGDAGKINADQKQFVDEIYQGNQRMVDLVNALLNVSRIDLGTFAIEPELINVTEIAKSVLEELRPKIIEKQIGVEKKYGENMPIIKADPKLIRIVFQNLLSNAIKYTPDKGKVTLNIFKKDKDLLIQVADTGYGIPKNQHSKIFTKLFRADNIQQKNVEGNGLGLYIVKSIIDQSDGKIWFESEENKGTIFYVTLPLKGMKKKEGAKGLS